MQRGDLPAEARPAGAREHRDHEREDRNGSQRRRDRTCQRGGVGTRMHERVLHTEAFSGDRETPALPCDP